MMPISDCQVKTLRPAESNSKLAVGNWQSAIYLGFNCAGDNRFANAIEWCTVFVCLLIDQLNVETERLQLTHQHVERLRQTWIEVSLAFYDCLVNFRASGNVV